MEYQKIINLLDNTLNQPTKFRTKNWVKINDEFCGTYHAYSQIKFKTSMLRSSLCDYSDAYILVSGTIRVAALAAGVGNNDVQVVFKSCVPFINCISEINNTQIDDAEDIDVVMPMYNLIEYCDSHSKTSGCLCQYYRDEQALNGDGTLANFPGNSVSFKFKQTITDSTGDDGIKAVQIIVPLKYLDNFCRTLEMPLINFKYNLILAWSANCVIPSVAANQNTTFAMTDTNFMFQL